MFTGVKKNDGAKVPIYFRSWNESSLKRKFSGANVPYWELSLPGAKVEERKGPLPVGLGGKYLQIQFQPLCHLLPKLIKVGGNLMKF